MTAIPAGYKQTEVGVIPADWGVRYLSDVSRKITDGDHVTPLRTSHGYYLLSARNVLNGRIDVSDVDYVGAAEYRRMKQRCGPEPGDILISCSGTIGRVAVVPSGFECVLVRSAALAKIDHGLADSVFLQFWLQGSKAQGQIAGSVNQGAQPNLFLNHIERLACPHPPLPEQRAIATALSDVDALLTKLDQLIAKKRDLKQATMQQLLTGKTRLPGFSGEWEVKRLGDVAQLRNGYAFQSATYTDLGNYKVVTIANVQDGYMTVDECNKVAALPQDIQQHQRLGRNDILISMTGNVGRVCRVVTDDCLLNQRVGKLVPTGVDDGFLFALLTQRKFLVSMGMKAKGGAQGNLAKPDITEFEILVPSDVSEQTAIANVLSNMDVEITALEARRDKTRALKQGMMQELLTGRIRLV